MLGRPHHPQHPVGAEPAAVAERRDQAGVSVQRPSGSGRITKSLPVPWPLVNRTTIILSVSGRYGRVSTRIIPLRKIGENTARAAPIRSGRRRPASDPRITAEPGPLPADEPPGRPDGLVPRLRFGQSPSSARSTCW